MKVQQPTFTAPGTPAVLTFTLSVTDSYCLPTLAPDQVVVTVTRPKSLIYLPLVLGGYILSMTVLIPSGHVITTR